MLALVGAASFCEPPRVRLPGFHDSLVQLLLRSRPLLSVGSSALDVVTGQLRDDLFRHL